MKDKSKTFLFGNSDFIKYRTSDSNIIIDGMTLNDIPVTRKALIFRYRYFLEQPTEWRGITWERASGGKNAISFSGDIRVNDEEKYIFKIEMILRNRQYSGGGKKFSGIGIALKALGTIPFAMEIEIGLPLDKSFRDCHIQDLYTSKKCSSITEKWTGLNCGIWQSQRSPFDFITSGKGTLLSRISSLFQPFSSGGEYEKDKGPLINYRYTFESCCKWKSAELSFLFSKDKITQLRAKDLWCEIFLSESEKFRKEAGVKREEVIPMANIPIDGGTPGCAPKEDMKIQGKFDGFAKKAIALCEEMNFKRVLVGSPWVSYRSIGKTVKAMASVVYDSRCGIIEFEIPPEYGGRKAFRTFCDRAHEKGIEVFVWYPGFHLANHSHYLTEHPEWIIRKSDGSPYTYVFFHITAISPRLEVQKHFIENLKSLKADCGFDGLWLDSYSFSFMTLDFSRNQGTSDAKDGILMIKRLQDAGLKIINEGYAPFGARGDGEAMYFIDQEDAAVDTSIFTYYKNIPEILKDNSYFRFLANKAPLTIAARYIPMKDRKTVSLWNKAFNEAVKFMAHRVLLENSNGVLWKSPDNVEILFTYGNYKFELKKRAVVTDLVSGIVQKDENSFPTSKFGIYKIEYR